jgi:polar amino acid transport system substrate-binding protein
MTTTMLSARLRSMTPMAACLLTLLLVLPGRAAGADCVLNVGWTPYGLYTFAGEDGQAQGIDADLFAAVATEIGCRANFRQLPWARILLELQSGTLDATSSASRTTERDAFALFSQPYRLAETAIYVRRNEVPRFPLQSLTDVPKARMRLGYVVGYYYGPTFPALQQDPTFAASTDGAADYEININKLLRNRIDGFLVDDTGVMIGWAKKLGVADQMERHPLRLASDELHLMLSRRTVSFEQLAKIDGALQRMRADGRMQAIFDRYLK